MATTINAAQVAQDFLGSIQAPGVNISPPRRGGTEWSAWCYWPNGDVIRDTACHGGADSLEAAIADMFAKIEDAKAQQKVLKTAAECKEAVMNLIREHDAAPASFRDAVDALPVKG